jgi:hypothetical protein
MEIRPVGLELFDADRQTDKGNSRYSQYLPTNLKKTRGPRLTANLNSASNTPKTCVCARHVERHQRAVFLTGLGAGCRTNPDATQ